MTIKELRELTGMKRTKFAEYFGIPYRTMQDWELGKSDIAPYLLDLMRYKLEKEGIIKK